VTSLCANCGHPRDQHVGSTDACYAVGMDCPCLDFTPAPDTAVVPMVRVPAELLRRCRHQIATFRQFAVSRSKRPEDLADNAACQLADLEADLNDALAAV
jgi:hypothetical protein